jgi:predicted nucleic acid-binding protein
MSQIRAIEGSARRFMKALLSGSHEIAFMMQGLMRRAAELDSRYADLDLGLVDACVMAFAERHELPILTFDFTDFRATESAAGSWQLAIDEQIFEREVGR